MEGPFLFFSLVITYTLLPELPMIYKNKNDNIITNKKKN